MDLAQDADIEHMLKVLTFSHADFLQACQFSMSYNYRGLVLTLVVYSDVENIMSRPLRTQYPGAWYHIINRGRRYENIFTDAKNYKVFVDLLKETSEM